jgi:hypothetical protein
LLVQNNKTEKSEEKKDKKRGSQQHLGHARAEHGRQPSCNRPHPRTPFTPSIFSFNFFIYFFSTDRWDRLVRPSSTSGRLLRKLPRSARPRFPFPLLPRALNAPFHRPCYSPSPPPSLPSNLWQNH